ncbi:hypothetical protein SDC9_170948 [bioreactor metagenome]|uniref:Uncharacterized protein n=1 Tax=bioreactor metagenome TaxID=1076179 RepID=A0A645GBR2_9ZZZZ
MGRVGACEDFPGFAGEAVGGDVDFLQRLEGERLHVPLGLAARRVGLEAALAHFVEQTFGNDGACRVAGADEQHVVDLVGHGAGSLVLEMKVRVWRRMAFSMRRRSWVVAANTRRPGSSFRSGTKAGCSSGRRRRGRSGCG